MLSGTKSENGLGDGFPHFFTVRWKMRLPAEAGIRLSADDGNMLHAASASGPEFPKGPNRKNKRLSMGILSPSFQGIRMEIKLLIEKTRET